MRTLVYGREEVDGVAGAVHSLEQQLLNSAEDGKWSGDHLLTHYSRGDSLDIIRVQVMHSMSDSLAAGRPGPRCILPTKLARITVACKRYGLPSGRKMRHCTPSVHAVHAASPQRDS